MRDLPARAFGTQAENYERGRPGWPVAAVADMIERFGARTVLDLAAGTGKLTRILVEHADEVIALEPLDTMRRILEERVPRARTMAGTAEAIPLPDDAVDAVFVAEALHWFDLDRAPAEIARVLRPGGWLAVMWNEAQSEGIPWLDELHQVVKAHRVRHDRRPDELPWRAALEAAIGPLHDEEATHERATDRERMLAEIASFSSIGGLPPERFDAAIAACRAVLERHGIDRVTLSYRTKIATAQLKRSGDSGPSAG